jgi:hypothetical protein
MREGIRSARRLYSAPIFKDSVLGTALPGKEVVSDEDLDVYIRNMTTTFTHGAGSAAMSPRGASWGVIDPDFRVKGTDGLRAVDASVLVSLDCIFFFFCIGYCSLLHSHQSRVDTPRHRCMPLPNGRVRSLDVLNYKAYIQRRCIETYGIDLLVRTGGR